MFEKKGNKTNKETLKAPDGSWALQHITPRNKRPGVLEGSQTDFQTGIDPLLKKNEGAYVAHNLIIIEEYKEGQIVIEKRERENW